MDLGVHRQVHLAFLAMLHFEGGGVNWQPHIQALSLGDRLNSVMDFLSSTFKSLIHVFFSVLS